MEVLKAPDSDPWGVKDLWIRLSIFVKRHGYTEDLKLS